MTAFAGSFQHLRQPFRQFRRRPVGPRHEFLDTLPDTGVISSSAGVLNLLQMLHHNKRRDGPSADIVASAQSRSRHPQSLKPLP
jgi:hypothetical protein